MAKQADDSTSKNAAHMQVDESLGREMVVSLKKALSGRELGPSPVLLTQE